MKIKIIKISELPDGLDLVFKNGKTLFLGHTLLIDLMQNHAELWRHEIYFLSRKAKDYIINEKTN